MAKADKRYTYEWFVTLNYDQWARSLSWIQDQVLANWKAGYLTDKQVLAIWANHEKVVQEKIDQRNQTNPPKIIQEEHAPPGGNLGSATGPSSDPSFFGKIAQGWGLIFDKAGEAAGNASGAITSGVSIGKYMVYGVLIIIVLKIFKK